MCYTNKFDLTYTFIELIPLIQLYNFISLHSEKDASCTLKKKKSFKWIHPLLLCNSCCFFSDCILSQPSCLVKTTYLHIYSVCVEPRCFVCLYRGTKWKLNKLLFWKSLSSLGASLNSWYLTQCRHDSDGAEIKIYCVNMRRSDVKSFQVCSDMCNNEIYNEWRSGTLTLLS